MTERAVALYTPECSKKPSSKAAASEGARRYIPSFACPARFDHMRADRYVAFSGLYSVERLSDARTPLDDFFSILLDRKCCRDLPSPGGFLVTGGTSGSLRDA